MGQASVKRMPKLANNMQTNLQLKMSMKKVFLAMLLCSISCVSFAQSARALEPYFVSGVLKLNGAEAVVKLAHGMVVSDSAENAQAVFKEALIRQFPQHSVVDVIASDFVHLYKSLPSSTLKPVEVNPVMRHGVSI